MNNHIENPQSGQYVQIETGKGLVPVLSEDCRNALAIRVLPDTPPQGDVPYFLPFDPMDLTARPLKYEIMSAGGSGANAIIERGGIEVVSLAKRPYRVDFSDGEVFDGPAYSIFDIHGNHFLLYAASIVRDLDNVVRVWGFPPYSPPLKMRLEYRFVGKNRLYKVIVQD